MAFPGPPPMVSVPPAGITWPMVAYAVVRELPYLAMVCSGAVVAVVLLSKIPGAALESLTAALAPTVVAALARSQPAESQAIRGLLGGKDGRP